MISALRAKQQELTREIRHLERIQSVIHRTYARSAITSETGPATSPIPVARRVVPRVLTGEFYAEAERSLTPGERVVFRRRLEGGQPALFDDAIGTFATEAVVDEANCICSEIRATTAADDILLPVAPLHDGRRRHR